MSLVLPPAEHKPASVPSPRSSRPSSIDLGAGSASVALTLASSLVDVHGYPRSSILLNSRKRTYKGLVYAIDPQQSPVAPVVTHIPAVPSRKHKEKEREREREREKERESLKTKSKDDEKIWGIPKKALYLGLNDISFQSSSSRSPLNSSSTLAPQGTDRKRRKSSSKRSDKADDSDDDDERQSVSSSRKSAENAADAEEPMDPEELAALNAIINTRRSMAAAQALVSGQIPTGPRSVRGSSFGSTDRPRPPLAQQRFASQDSVPSMSSFTQSSHSSINISNNMASPADDRLGASGSAAESSKKSPTSEQNRIRFAPLPQPTVPVPAGRRPVLDSNGQPIPLEGSDDDLGDSDLSDSDYDSDDEETKSAMKGKWYLMGMPPAVFTSQYYTGKSSRRSKLPRTGSVSSFGGEDDPYDGGSMHRKSTSSLTEAFSSDTLRKFSASSDVDDETRGRPSNSSIKSKRSKSQPRRRSRSRNGAISSGDEDERARRRQLIRLARPGGTGMVTLPDGTKIRARRVNDSVDTEEPEFIEWGFAGLAREASRRGMNSSNPASLATTPNGGDQKSLSTFMAAEEDEEDDGSGMAWVRRRRREREERARLELENATRGEITYPPAQEDTDAVVADVQMSSQSETPAAAATEVSPAKAMDRKDSVQAASPLLPSAERKTSSTEAAMVPHASDHGSARRPSLVEGPAKPVLFADPESLPASPTIHATPAMDACSISEASFAENRTPLSGSQLLSKVYQGTGTGDSTPRHTAPGLTLSANQAEIIRKRHEDEVAALGAEVLAQNRRNTQRRQASTAGPLLTGAVSTNADLSADLTSKSTKPAQTTSGTSTPSANVSASRDSAFEKNPLARAVGSIMRKATADSDRTVKSGNEDGGKKPAEPPLPLVAEPTTPPETVASPKMRSQSPESTLSHKSSSLGEPTSPATNKSVSSLHATSNIPSTHSPMSKRMAMNASISTPAPSPWLPRRPDARGLAVVPLPQLGVRPERPREGRVWQFDVSDESDAAAEGASDKEDEENSDLDAEELEEEELKTAMQKKRATTRAAGQEIVHTSLESKATSRAASKMSSSFDLEPVRQPKVPSTASKRRSTVAGTRYTGSAQPSTPRKAPPRLVRSKTTTRRTGDRGDDDDDDSDEKDLWPAASATSKTGTPRPRHMLVNLPGGPGIWDSKTGGGRNAVAAINSVAAARAKAIKKRADKGTSFELPPGWDDEMMDYGWPRSLKGSLY